jgi:SynChlorMet cassette protein ScmC
MGYTIMVIIERPQRMNSYRLKLANGQTWQIIAANEDTYPWVKKLATIMELKNRKNYHAPRLIFIRTNDHKNGDDKMLFPIEKGLEHLLPTNGWFSHPIKGQRFLHHIETKDILCDIGSEETEEAEFTKMWQSLLPIYQRAQEDGGIPFHAALIEKNGRGVLIGASGGTGKSTCSRRIPPPWRAPSDDEALIVKDLHGQYMVHPFPTWSDYLWRRSEKTWPVEYFVPLAAIFFLERSETDKIISLKQGEAAVMILQLASQILQRYWINRTPAEVRALRLRLFENASALTRDIPSYILQARLTGCFWKTIDHILNF